MSVAKASYLLLDAVTADTEGTEVNPEPFGNFLFAIVAASVTTGATVTIEGRLRKDGDWRALHVESVSASGTTIVQLYDAQLYGLRAKVTSRTDGTYTVECSARE